MDRGRARERGGEGGRGIGPARSGVKIRARRAKKGYGRTRAVRLSKSLKSGPSEGQGPCTDLRSDCESRQGGERERASARDSERGKEGEGEEGANVREAAGGWGEVGGETERETR